MTNEPMTNHRGMKAPAKFNENQVKMFMYEWKEDANIPDDSKVIFFWKYTKSGKFILDVYTEYPGYLIGKGGNKVKYASDQLKQFGVDAIYVTEIRPRNIV